MSMFILLSLEHLRNFIMGVTSFCRYDSLNIQFIYNIWISFSRPLFLRNIFIFIQQLWNNFEFVEINCQLNSNLDNLN